MFFYVIMWLPLLACLFVVRYYTGAEGAMDASNMLKPALARGELQCVGASTLDEYRQHIEKDSALERRFAPVYVEEPDIDDIAQAIWLTQWMPWTEEQRQNRAVEKTASNLGAS